LSRETQNSELITHTQNMNLWPVGNITTFHLSNSYAHKH